MTTRLTPLALVTALLLGAAACGGQQQSAPPAAAPPAAAPATAAAHAPSGPPPPPVPAMITIPLRYKDEMGMCVGRLKDHNDYKHKVMWTTQVKFTLDVNDNGNNNACSSFDYTRACIQLSTGDKLLAMEQYCSDASKEINVTISDDMIAVPDKSHHLYSIRYKDDSGGDPELDIDCGPCDNGRSGGH